jgi:hypothetical protein
MGVQKKTLGLLKKFEQDHEIYVDAQDAQFYWMTNSRIPKKQESHHRAGRYISGRNEEENVLIFSYHNIMDTCCIENRGTIASFEDFADKALAAIPGNWEESDRKLQEGCGTSCDY